MHTFLTVLAIICFAICLAGAVAWCLSRATASIPAKVWLFITNITPGLHGDPWPGWHETHDPNWVNEISAPMPALTGEVLPPRSLDAKVRETIARADAMRAVLTDELPVTDVAVSDDAKV